MGFAFKTSAPFRMTAAARQCFRAVFAWMWAADRSSATSLKTVAILLFSIAFTLLIRKFTFLPNNYLLWSFNSPYSSSLTPDQQHSKSDEYLTADRASIPVSASPLLKIAGSGNSSVRQAPGDLIILLWTSMFANWNWGLSDDVVGHRPYVPAGCPVTNCLVTTDRNVLQEASTVLVHFRDDFRYNDRPAIRPPNQHWVFVLWESPMHSYSWNPITTRTSRPYLAQDFKGFFNWTMTFRMDSDIPLYYGGFKKKITSAPLSTDALPSPFKKTRMAITMASNCGTSSNRVEYIREMSRFIDVEIVGDCSDSWSANLADGICAQAKDRGTPDACLKYMSENYKFYLAFENSLCHDYVTEKFFRAASLDLIPVVLNGANMSRFAPPHSYIDARDFASPEELARYLEKVANDEQLYKSYFWWKAHYDPHFHWDFNLFENSFCDLCTKANLAKLEPKKYEKVYDDIDGWWMAGGKCRQGDVAPNQQLRSLLDRIVIALSIPLIAILALKIVATASLFLSKRF